ncbi:MAG: helix-turn-helix domain-containing protein [Cyclobacteriaceae bacterium]
MEDYNKIIESLSVKFVAAKFIKILQPVKVNNFYDVNNSLMLLEKGKIAFGDDNEVLEEGDILFVPSGKLTAISYGRQDLSKPSNVDVSSNMDKYLISANKPVDFSNDDNTFSLISVDAKVFDSVNFFQSLDIPAFAIKQNSILKQLLQETVAEHYTEDLAGTQRVVKLNADRIILEVFRYIIKERLFVEQLATNVTYFKDPRLLDIFAFIKENLPSDLSNKTLANVANVSEDYVGQYFKLLTGINPQDYIEYQRMEKAVSLLRTTKRSIREIGKDVGYKDTAYFCRRFKMMFGIPAGKMRRRESLMNV